MSRLFYLVSTSSKIWFLIATIEFIVILILLYFRMKGKRSSNNEILKMKSVKLDMDVVLSDIFKAKELYDELARKCHPDRFIGTDKEQEALRIFQELSANRRSYTELVRIREVIQTRLIN